MTEHDSDPNNESPFGLIHDPDSPFGPPLVGAGYPEPAGPVPPYEKRVSVLMGDAHALLLGIETRLDALRKGGRTPEETWTSLERELPSIRRWLDRHELHICQIDHPDLRDARPLGVLASIEGEVL